MTFRRLLALPCLVLLALATSVFGAEPGLSASFTASGQVSASDVDYDATLSYSTSNTSSYHSSVQIAAVSVIIAVDSGTFNFQSGGTTRYINIQIGRVIRGRMDGGGGRGHTTHLTQ